MRSGLIGLLCLVTLFLAGCAATRGVDKVGLPVKHSVSSDQLLILSDFKLTAEHPLVQDLIVLRKQVSRVLDLPLGSKQVMVYLFSTELEYRQYWQATYPGYPPRRAYFVKTPDQKLAVYTYWGERIHEDLRHEFTHGLLHAALTTVPLWLDEGLAEYFEVPGTEPGDVNRDSVQRLVAGVQNGWRPDMKRLESLEKVDQMHRADYREAWAWVHFMLHHSPDSKQVLLGYLQQLRTNPNPILLSDLLKNDIPDYHDRMLSYVASLNSYGRAAAGTEEAGVVRTGGVKSTTNAPTAD